MASPVLDREHPRWKNLAIGSTTSVNGFLRLPILNDYISFNFFVFVSDIWTSKQQQYGRVLFKEFFICWFITFVTWKMFFWYNDRGLQNFSTRCVICRALLSLIRFLSLPIRDDNISFHLLFLYRISEQVDTGNTGEPSSKACKTSILDASSVEASCSMTVTSDWVVASKLLVSASAS